MAVQFAFRSRAGDCDKAGLAGVTGKLDAEDDGECVVVEHGEEARDVDIHVQKRDPPRCCLQLRLNQLQGS